MDNLKELLLLKQFKETHAWAWPCSLLQILICFTEVRSCRVIREQPCRVGLEPQRCRLRGRLPEKKVYYLSQQKAVGRILEKTPVWTSLRTSTLRMHFSCDPISTSISTPLSFVIPTSHKLWLSARQPLGIHTLTLTANLALFLKGQKLPFSLKCLQLTPDKNFCSWTCAH